MNLPLSLSAADQEEPDVQLEAITVTAEKRGENIQDVPVSISAFSETQIEDAGILVTEDLIYAIPNLNMVKLSNHGSGSALSMRRISTVHGDLSMSPAVGFYVDDVYYSGGLDTQLLDLERIEVLRGPQGTLYGRNTAAGLINLITNTRKADGYTLVNARIGYEAQLFEIYLWGKNLLDE